MPRSARKRVLHPDAVGVGTRNSNQPFQSTTESPLYLPFHHAAHLSQIPTLRNLPRALPSTHHSRDRFPRPFQRRQIQPAQRAIRVEAGPRLIHPRANPRHQLLLHHRFAAAPAAAALLRRSARLRLRQALKIHLVRVAEIHRALSLRPTDASALSLSRRQQHPAAEKRCSAHSLSPVLQPPHPRHRNQG